MSYPEMDLGGRFKWLMDSQLILASFYDIKYIGIYTNIDDEQKK